MIANNLGYPRIGSHRELKKACEQYWAGKINPRQLRETAAQIRKSNWITQQQAGIDLIPCNDFSFYDHVLDMSLTVNAIPQRFHDVALRPGAEELDLYFAMARGYQKDGLDITAMEMTKWFDTNYHYIVPEFTKNQKFSLFSNQVVNTFVEAKEVLGQVPKPVLIGPVSYLLAGKEKEKGFHRLDLLDNILPVYEQILERLVQYGAQWIQFDEPFLVMDPEAGWSKAITKVYDRLAKAFPQLKLMVATYFECSGPQLDTLVSLPVACIHVDVVRCPSQLEDILATPFVNAKTALSLGVVDGRNIWINDYEHSLALIRRATTALGDGRIMIAPSCSLLHVPCDLTLETGVSLTPEIKNWMAFARQKLDEVVTLKDLSAPAPGIPAQERLAQNVQAIASRRNSPSIHRAEIKARAQALTPADAQRLSPFDTRQQIQDKALNLPLFPTTTIGSFPQTEAIRQQRARFKKGGLSEADYEAFLREETASAIHWQEDIGLDVLVHGEFERNDMVEYFGEQLDGFAFSQNGWVQSYGSRCVKPPIIYGDVTRPRAMTVQWAAFAQSCTTLPVKGMLTGPVTILQWSFVRNDQTRRETCMQIALAIRDEVTDLEKAGIRIIQIDEPAIREGLPLRKEDQPEYLDWAVTAFRVSASGVGDQTQIHTHMCYSEFNDIIRSIAGMDADVITIETSRSQMELLDAFVDFRYPNGIGPGVYDIHSPRVPTAAEMVALLQKAAALLPAKNLWVNPDCGLKTRHWPETAQALQNMVQAARAIRETVLESV